MDHMTWSPRLSALVLPTGANPVNGMMLEHNITAQPAGPATAPVKR
jgi:hypothetical protein